MGNTIKTRFDSPLEEDVTFEQTENQQEISDLLKNTENIYKAFLYMKEMFSSAPVFNKIVNITYVDDVTDEDISINEEANLLTFKNNNKDTSEIYYNDNDKLVLYAYEQIDIPVFSGDTIKITGTMNIIQMKYEIR